MLAKYKQSWIFGISLLGALMVPALFPSCRFLYFAPFLIVSFYQNTLWVTLWKASGVGILDDLFSTTIFGVSSCNYVITAALLYRLKRHFFEDNASTLFIMTFLFSLISTTTKFFLEKILGNSFPMTFGFFMTDIIMMPAFEGIYAYTIFILPYQLFKAIKRIALFRQRKNYTNSKN